MLLKLSVLKCLSQLLNKVKIKPTLTWCDCQSRSYFSYNVISVFNSGLFVLSPLQMFFEDHIDDAKYCGHLYGLGSGSSYVQNGTGNAYEEEVNKQQS